MAILQRVRAYAPGLPQAVADRVEREIRAELGGLRVRIPKRGKHLTPEQRETVFRMGLSNLSNEAIQASAGISRRTLYRLMKRGSGSGGAA